MDPKLDMLKILFDEFLQGSKTVFQYDQKNELALNASVFDFQAHITRSLKDLNLNLSLNPGIHSESIRRSFDGTCKPFSAHDYCLSFFDFLNVHKAKRLELFHLIDLFVEQHKDELTWQDIVLTASGATRCRTNLRFALDKLRSVGLIKNLDGDGRRVYVPTRKGELVFFAWRTSINNGVFDPGIFDQKQSHNILIRNTRFHCLYSVLQGVAKHGRYVAAFQNYKNLKTADEEVEEILKDIKKFLDDAVITKQGIFLKENKGRQ